MEEKQVDVEKKNERKTPTAADEAASEFFCGRAGVLVGVVPGDEGIRVCGERGTTPRSPKTPLARGTWCPATKE